MLSNVNSSNAASGENLVDISEPQVPYFKQKDP